VDISFDYLNTVARHVEVSGDTTFATDHWSSIAAAYQYCQSVIRASDHLPHIPADKEGGDEQDRPDDDLSLSSSWVVATDSFAELAALTGHHRLVDAARKASELAKVAIASRYWDAEHHFWFEGHTQSGRPLFGWRLGPGQAIVQKIFSIQQNDELLNEIASSDFQADWGTRAVAARSAIYDPDSYGKGSVWALGTSSTAATFWQEHRPTIAFAIWSAMRRWNTLDSLGHIHEVLREIIFTNKPSLCLNRRGRRLVYLMQRWWGCWDSICRQLKIRSSSPRISQQTGAIHPLRISACRTRPSRLRSVRI